MNRYGQHLAYTSVALLLGLPLGCVVAGLLIGGWGLAMETGDPGGFPNAFASGGVVAMAAVLVGILPSYLYGAPLYALLAHRDYANTASTILIGAIPGLIALPFEPGLAVLLLLFGVCVALATHFIAKRRLATVRSGR